MKKLVLIFVCFMWLILISNHFKPRKLENCKDVIPHNLKTPTEYIDLYIDCKKLDNSNCSKTFNINKKQIKVTCLN